MTQIVSISMSPHPLEDLLPAIKYLDWQFEILGYGGFDKYLRINVPTFDSQTPPGRTCQILVSHQFPLPTYEGRDYDWERWLLNCIIQVTTHEVCEFFQVGDEKPYYPEHGGNANPYRISRK